MNIVVHSIGTTTLLALQGRFDAHEVAAFRAATAGIAQHRTTLRLDLGRVGFIDSSALAELVSLHRTLQGVGGALDIFPMSDAVRIILELTGLGPVLAGGTARSRAGAA